MGTFGVAVVGSGYWGQNLIRSFWETEECRLVSVCDLDEKALGRMGRRYPTLELVREFEELLKHPQVDAIALATPVSTHYNFARRALEAGKHILVEKPLATRSTEVLELMELAEKRSRTLMVDHTFLYTGAVRRMKRMVEAGEIGDLLYYDSVRVNLGLVQSDTNVLWDLAPHDFSIMDHLFGKEPVSVSAIGVRHLDFPFENIAYVTVRFACNFIAHFHVNWLAPVKVRMTLVGGTKKMIVYDDMEPSEKIKVYDRGITVNHDPEGRTRMLAGYRIGDMQAPNLESTEALRLMAREFCQASMEGRTPLTDGTAGYRVVRLLEAAQRSIDQNGRVVELGEPAVKRGKVDRAAVLA